MHKKTTTLFFLIVIFSSYCSFAQLQSTWVKTLYYEISIPVGGDDSLGKGPKKIVVASDGTFFVLSDDSRAHRQSIYHIDSTGRILSSIPVGQSTTSTITNASNLYATPDSGCIYLESLSYIGTPDFRLLKISKFGIRTTIKSWINSNGGPQEYVHEVIPNHHNGYYCRIDSTIIDIPSNTILTENRFIVFDNDDYLVSDSLLKRKDISGNTLWSANIGSIIAHSENSIYLQSDSLRKLDAISGNYLWTKPLIAGTKFDMMRSTEGLVILNGRTVYVMDPNGNIIDSNNISLTYQTPTTISSLNDGSILTGGAFINYAGNPTPLGRYYSVFLIKLNEEAKGVVDSTDFYIAGDADQDSNVSYIKDGLFIAAAIGQHTPVNQVNENTFTERTTYSELWPEESGCGINYRYADAAMDGVINSDDIRFLDIYYNHRTNSPSDTSGSIVRIVYDNNVVSPGDTITASVILGTASRPTDSICGFSIEPLLSWNYNIGSSFILDYKNGVLGDTSANLNIYTSDRSFSTIYLGVIFCRNDQQNISISGDTIFRISAVLPPSMPIGPSGFPSSCFMIKANGCYAPVNIISDSLFIISTSISNLNSNGSIKIFPNPATEETTISSENGLLGTVKIKDISGKTVFEKNVNETKYILQTTSLENGIYIIETYSNKIYSFQKLIVSQN